MKICFAIYMLGMAALASFEPPAPAAHDALRAGDSVRESGFLRAPTTPRPVAAMQRAGAVPQQ